MEGTFTVAGIFLERRRQRRNGELECGQPGGSRARVFEGKERGGRGVFMGERVRAKYATNRDEIGRIRLGFGKNP